MLEPRPDAPDDRPALVICAYDLDETGWDPVEDLSGHPWNPIGARTLAVAGGEAEALATLLSDHLADRCCGGLLLVGRTRCSEAFRLQIRAENRTADGTQRIDSRGPGTARVTAPVAAIVQALNNAGLAADVSSDSEEGTGSALLYRVLCGLADGSDTPVVGLLRAPEHAPAEAVQTAVKAAAQVMAGHMPALPRSRAS